MSDIKLVAIKEKSAGRPARFSFAVPFDAADKVAFHLAKAGMEGFRVKDTGTEEAIFTFHTEPELQIAEEIVQQEFAEQIANRKGVWEMWAPEPPDPSAVKEIETRGKPLVSSDKTAADSELDEALADTLRNLDRLSNIESSADIMELARMTAADLRQFAADYKAGRARKFSFSTGQRCQACSEILPDVKNRVIKSAKEVIETPLCNNCQIDMAKEL